MAVESESVSAGTFGVTGVLRVSEGDAAGDPALNWKRCRNLRRGSASRRENAADEPVRVEGFGRVGGGYRPPLGRERGASSGRAFPSKLVPIKSATPNSALA